MVALWPSASGCLSIPSSESRRGFQHHRLRRRDLVGSHYDDHGCVRREHYPVTAVGRLVAFGLMIGGIALLGTVTATLASWLIETVAAEKVQAEDLQVTVRRLEDKIDQLAAEKKSGLDQADRRQIPLGSTWSTYPPGGSPRCTWLTQFSKSAGSWPGAG
jgi:hypothetical protein